MPRRLSNVGGDIAGQQHCASGMLCVDFQTHCLKGDLKMQALALNYTSSQVDVLQLPLRKVNDIITSIVSHLILHFHGHSLEKLNGSMLN